MVNARNPQVDSDHSTFIIQNSLYRLTPNP
jgi:hypothetical protein